MNNKNLINELKDSFLDSIAQYHRMLYFLRFSEGLSLAELKMIDRVVKTEAFTLKMVKLSRDYYFAIDIIERLRIKNELRYLRVNLSTFLELVQEVTDDE